MIVTNIHEAKTQLSKLIEKVLEGEEVVISKAGKPLVKMVAYQVNREPRKPGNWQGKVKMSEDFDELPEEVLKLFYE